MAQPDPNDKKVLAGLVAKVRKGDASALDLLLRATSKRVYYFCLHLCGNEALAEDLMQETLIRAISNVASLRKDEEWVSWMYTIARNRFIDTTRLSETKVETLALRDEEEHEVISELPAVELGEAEERWLIREVLQGIHAEFREALILVDQEGMTSEEAAAVIGISSTALRSRVHRARKQFRDLYEKLQEEAKGRTP